MQHLNAKFLTVSIFSSIIISLILVLYCIDPLKPFSVLMVKIPVFSLKEYASSKSLINSMPSFFPICSSIFSLTFSAFFLSFGKITVLRLEQPSNALSSIVLTLPLKTTLSNSLQPRNADSPILLIFSPKTTLSNFLHPENA